TVSLSLPRSNSSIRKERFDEKIRSVAAPCHLVRPYPAAISSSLLLIPGAPGGSGGGRSRSAPLLLWEVRRLFIMSVGVPPTISSYARDGPGCDPPVLPGPSSVDLHRPPLGMPITACIHRRSSQDFGPLVGSDPHTTEQRRKVDATLINKPPRMH